MRLKVRSSVEVAHLELRWRGGRGRAIGDDGDERGGHGHLRKSARAATLMPRTSSVMSAAPPHASRCQSSYGLIANWKITTGRFAIGRFMSVDMNWLLSAVKRSGAVSPAMRATASRIPVTMPARAARYETPVITFQLGAPRAAAAS